MRRVGVLMSTAADDPESQLRTHDCLIAKLDLRIGAQIEHPDGVLRRSALGAHEHVAVAVLDAHQWCLADGAGLVARVGYQDYRQASVAQGGAPGAAAALVELDLLSYPVSGAWNVFSHRTRPLYRCRQSICSRIRSEEH